MRLHPNWRLAPLALGLLLARPALAADLTVGPGKTYATPCAAIGKASPGDTVLVSPGASAYTDSCEINVANLTVKGVDGQPKIDLSGTQDPADDKGIYVVNADNVTLANLELTGANVDDNDGSNGAAIRDQATGLVVSGCYIHDNQDGILATPASAGSTLVVEYSQLDHNALGDGCASSGCTHNIYVGSANMETFVFAFNWSHNINSGLSSGTGHLLKTRAQKSYILYNALLGEEGADSYELDVPQGGLAVIVGNILQKPTGTGNGNSLSYGEEGLLNTSSDLFVASNTFYSDASGTTFIHVASGATLTAHNNLFGSAGTASTTGPLSADNLQPTSPLFVDAATFNFHLLAGSPAIGHGVTPGSAEGFSLVPVYEYVQPDESVVRAVGAALDVGAFQYGTNLSGAAATATITVGDAGTPALPDAGSTSGGDSGISGKSDAGSSKAPSKDAGKGRPNDAAVAGRGGDAGSKHADATLGGDAAAGSSGSSGGCSVGARDADAPGACWVGLGVAAIAVPRRRRG